MIRLGFKSAMVLASLALLIACEKKAAPPIAPVKTEQADGNPTRAQPKLRTLKLWLGSEELTTELALTFDQVRTGMMFRTNMAENEAMLFVFTQPHRAGFWMKNTFLPLSCAYIDPEGTILEIHDMEPHNTNAIVAASERIQYVLETRQGWFQRHNIREGTLVKTEVGTLKETFRPRR